MSTFGLYFRLGMDHILDTKGFDHILFLLALLAVYEMRHWKSLLWLLTAFTLGHSLTLALSALNLIRVDAALVELLIAITIGITAIQNLFLDKPDKKVNPYKYGLAAFFGLIHGLGFSGYFKQLLGTETSILMPLFSFNIGIEAAQILFALGVILLHGLLTGALGVKPREWNLFVSGGAFMVALTLVLERW